MLDKEDLNLPNIVELMGYKVYFWANENHEPIHVHISKGRPTKNSTKIWLTKTGGCVVANNKSRIPERDLNILLEAISLYYFQIIAKWKIVYNTNEVKFYC